MRRAWVPICLIAVLTVFGIYWISNEYTSSLRSRTDTHNGQSAPVMGTAPSEEGEPEVTTQKDTSVTYFTGVLTDADHDAKLLTLKDVESDREAELPYDGTTEFYDKYGQGITARELSCGEVLDVGFSEKKELLKAVQQSANIWTLSSVEKFSVDEKKHIFTIADEAYKFTDDIFIYSDGEKGEWMDVTDLDTLTVRGKDRSVYSIVVEKGHGYIRIVNDSYFVGGWIEVGKAVIRTITEDMLLPVPEGDFHVRLTNKGYLGEEDVRITRNKETLLDLSKIEIEEVAIGHVEFHIDPVYAQLFIDGTITDYEERVPLEYGVHTIRIEAAGYEPVTTSIKIGSEYANVDISLDLDPDAEADSTTQTPFNGSSRSNPYAGGTPAPSDTSNSVQTGIYPTGTIQADTSTATNVISATKKIYVEEPKGAEVYLDGSYIGIAPASTPKVTGTHVITLSQSGRETKSYSVNINNDGNDITFSFSALNASE